jgi:hypothetical protein
MHGCGSTNGAGADRRREESYLTAAEDGLAFISQLQLTDDSAAQCPDQHFLTACHAAVDQRVGASTF